MRPPSTADRAKPLATRAGHRSRRSAALVPPALNMCALAAAQPTSRQRRAAFCAVPSFGCGSRLGEGARQRRDCHPVTAYDTAAEAVRVSSSRQSRLSDRRDDKWPPERERRLERQRRANCREHTRGVPVAEREMHAVPEEEPDAGRYFTPPKVRR